MRRAAVETVDLNGNLGAGTRREARRPLVVLHRAASDPGDSLETGLSALMPFSGLECSGEDHHNSAR